MKQHTPVITRLLIGMTVAGFLLQWAGDAFLGHDLALALGAKINEAIRSGQVWRLLTPMLLHGSVLHIAFNMLALHSLGPGLELHYGRGRFLALYLLSALGGNVLSFRLSDAVSVGASTAIYGLFAAELIFVLQNRRLLGPSGQAALRQMGGLLLVNILISLSPGIDLWGHLGGLLAGAAFAALAGPKLSWIALEDGYLAADRRSRWAAWAAGLGLFLVIAQAAAVGMGR